MEEISKFKVGTTLGSTLFELIRFKKILKLSGSLGVLDWILAIFAD